MKPAGITSAVLTSALVTPFCILASCVVADAGQDVAAEHELRVARGDARRVQLLGRSAMRTCETTAPFFCARPVMSSTLQPLPSRCAAMPISAPIVTTPVPPMPVTRIPYGSRRRRERGLGQRGKLAGLRLLRLAQAAALDGDEARAEALHARVVLVARALVDRALAAELGLDRRDRHAVRLDAAIAAALADELVDDDALRRIGKLAALAAAALLGGAGLVVEQHRAAGRLAQLALHARRARRGGGPRCRPRNSRTDICPARR